MTKETIDVINNIGKDSLDQNKDKNKKKIRECVEYEKMQNWLMSIMLSLVPILIIPYGYYLFSKISLEQLGIEIFGGCEIIFVGVTLLVIEINDFVKSDYKNTMRKEIIWIVMGTIFYTVLVMFHKEEREKENIISPKYLQIVTVNIIYLVISFFMGLSNYIKYIHKERKHG